MKLLILGSMLAVLGGLVGLIDKWKKKDQQDYMRGNTLSSVLLLTMSVMLLCGFDFAVYGEVG